MGDGEPMKPRCGVHVGIELVGLTCPACDDDGDDFAQAIADRDRLLAAARALLVALDERPGITSSDMGALRIALEEAIGGR